jgi:hypothetical protein
MKTDANEPIAPLDNYGNVGAYGLTKLEYFASQALIGILANGKILDERCITDTSVCIANKLIN